MQTLLFTDISCSEGFIPGPGYQQSGNLVASLHMTHEISMPS